MTIPFPQTRWHYPILRQGDISPLSPRPTGWSCALPAPWTEWPYPSPTQVGRTSYPGRIRHKRSSERTNQEGWPAHTVDRSGLELSAGPGRGLWSMNPVMLMRGLSCICNDQWQYTTHWAFVHWHFWQEWHRSIIFCCHKMFILNQCGRKTIKHQTTVNLTVPPKNLNSVEIW